MPRVARFNVAAVDALYRQLQFAPRPTRLRQMNAAETLVADIEPDRNYPSEFVVFRITGYRPEAEEAPEVLVGAALRGDLVNLVQALSADLALPVDFDGREALALEHVARELNVSIKTIQRYRRDGLVCHYVRGNGAASRLVCFRDALDRFVQEYPRRLARAAAFGRIDEAVAARIVDEARALRAADGCSLNEAARRLATRHRRAHETMRNLLQRHDRRATQPIFGERGPLTDRDARIIERADRLGVPVSTLAARMGRTPATIHRSLNRQRGRRLRSLEIDWIELPTFVRDDAEAVILAAPVVTDGLEDLLPAGPAHELLDAAHAMPTPATELVEALVGGYHILRRRASTTLGSMPAWPTSEALDRIETDLRWATRLKRRLVSLGLPSALVCIERYLHHPLLAQPGERLGAFVQFAVEVVAGVVDTLDPGHGQRLEGRAVLEMDRALAAPQRHGHADLARRPEGRAAARHEPGTIMVERPFADLSPWERWLELRQDLVPLCDVLPNDARALMTRHYGLGAEAPESRAELADRFECSFGSISRRLRSAKTTLRQELRQRAGKSA